MMVISEIAAACLPAPQRGNTQRYGPIIMCRPETCVWTDARGLKRWFYCGAATTDRGLGSRSPFTRAPLTPPSPPPGGSEMVRIFQTHVCPEPSE